MTRPRPLFGRIPACPPGTVGQARVLAGAGLLLLLAGAGCARSPAPPAGNLVVVCIDTLRTSHLGAYGYRRATSPAIDALAARGALFRSAQSPSNWTVPAVGSILTGRLPSEHGAHLGAGPRELGRAPEAPRSLRQDLPLLSELLARQGFATALWSGNPYLYGRFKDGFQTATVGRADGDAQIDAILAWLAARGGGRFFLYWQIMDLHQPLDPPAALERRFAADAPPGFPSEKVRDWDFARLEDDATPAFRAYREQRTALYDATLVHVDELVRRLLDELRRAGLERSTLVVVTADHGEEFWDHWREERALADDPRGIWGIGHGHTMYQELLHVPLVFAGPGVAAGARSPCPVDLLDLVPTALARLGLPPLPGARGRDLSPLLAGDHPPCAARPLLAEAPAYGPDSFALRLGRFKLVRRGEQVVRLYDLAGDPEERTDLAPRRPDAVAQLTALARAARGPAASATPETVLDEKVRADLRALGYL